MRQHRSQDFVHREAVAFFGGALCKKRKLLGLQMVLGLRFGAGAVTSCAGTGAPAAPAPATRLNVAVAKKAQLRFSAQTA